MTHSLVNFDKFQFQNSDPNDPFSSPVIDKEFLQLFDYLVNIPKFRYGNAEYSCYTRLVKFGDNAVNEIKRYLESLKPRKSILYQLLKNETHMILRMAHVEPMTESAIENSRINILHTPTTYHPFYKAFCDSNDVLMTLEQALRHVKSEWNGEIAFPNIMYDEYCTIDGIKQQYNKSKSGIIHLYYMKGVEQNKIQLFSIHVIKE